MNFIPDRNREVRMKFQMLCKTCVAAVLALALIGTEARAQSADFTDWLKGLRAEALTKGVSTKTLDSALTGLKPIPRIVELDRQQPEFTLTFQQYLSRVVPKSRIAKGKRKFNENRALLTEIGKKYAVQPRFIVAFWGIETDFGHHFGGFSVVASLATLAFDGRRSKFFRSELLRALRILEQGHISPRRMKGSWAGAMGNFQFMPSSFETFAVDYDGDGKRDIWTNKGDAFASAANYLSKSGWRSDQTWGRAVKLPLNMDKSLLGLKVRKTVNEWQKLGVRRLDGRDLPKRNLNASIVIVKGSGGAAFMVYKNFRVTLKWNRSIYFAVAVGILAEGIGRS